MQCRDDLLYPFYSYALLLLWILHNLWFRFHLHQPVDFVSNIDELFFFTIFPKNCLTSCNKIWFDLVVLQLPSIVWLQIRWVSSLAWIVHVLVPQVLLFHCYHYPCLWTFSLVPWFLPQKGILQWPAHSENQIKIRYVNIPQVIEQKSCHSFTNILLFSFPIKTLVLYII